MLLLPIFSGPIERPNRSYMSSNHSNPLPFPTKFKDNHSKEGNDTIIVKAARSATIMKKSTINGYEKTCMRKQTPENSS